MGLVGYMELVSEATKVRQNAYAPYSGYLVGCALRDETGRIHVGCNTENASFGATICAERSAILAMIAAGGRQIRSLVVATRDGGSPCGMCLQVISEFADGDLAILLVSEDGSETYYTLDELFPVRFELKEGETRP